ncbi:hypothetical protein [Heyndrickxia oleronia]|jgi:hypothetical protein|uniref:hypothetical protein n=1 Tax=Heyndrickxia oleronia TaxID=38875 RepID=UPI00242E5358|nr:hypothetical protein [Heyndrickxia oleronia]MCI1590374.1 hypothetical protein [Heyndrickxia oleronia]MCI1611364.1 hypothetical protein [Heyndrickxia oleronia]MCI1742807.1 hypothetical protein [Heyndrickxia oleronia]MCI1763108.1 hypothetical protein [Heyndrickxia oleronia]
MSVKLAGQLDELLGDNHNLLPESLRKMRMDIHYKLDLPVTNPMHKFNAKETEEMIKWLETKPVKNSDELISYVKKVHLHGDI